VVQQALPSMSYIHDPSHMQVIRGQGRTSHPDDRYLRRQLAFYQTMYNIDVFILLVS
jgi:hypothetical protein